MEKEQCFIHSEEASGAQLTNDREWHSRRFIRLCYVTQNDCKVTPTFSS
jgi:hypothetical protein